MARKTKKHSSLEEWKKGKIYQLMEVDGVVIGVYVNPEETVVRKKQVKK